MRKIQSWNGTTWINVLIQDLPLGRHVIKISEELDIPTILRFKNIPIHACSKAPLIPQLTIMDLRIINELNVCPFCQEELHGLPGRKASKSETETWEQNFLPTFGGDGEDS